MPESFIHVIKACIGLIDSETYLHFIFVLPSLPQLIKSDQTLAGLTGYSCSQKGFGIQSPVTGVKADKK
jgi:hypothetical protein